MSSADKLAYLGANTGNLLIGQSLREQLVLDSYGTGQPDPGYAREHYDTIVIPAANFLFHKFDLGFIADYLEQVPLPTYMIGVGAQAPSPREFEGIPEGTKRLLSIVSERSASIGVRGQFTAEIMDNLGFRNTQAVGCPSMYRTQTPTLSVRPLSDTRHPRISINGSRDVVAHSFNPSAAAHFERELIEFGMRNRSAIVLQSEVTDIAIAEGDASLPSNALSSLSTQLSKVGYTASSSEYFRYIRDCGRVFYSIEPWDNHFSNVDVSYGSRFHGNLIALTNGVPAFVVTHDMRTTELCELFAIPHARVDEVSNVNPTESVLHSNYEAFSARYAEMYLEYVKFLGHNGLDNTLHVPPSGR